MALPDKELTSGQHAVMEPLLANFQAAQSRVEGALKLRDQALAAMEEYIRQAAEKQAIAVGTDYMFSLDQKKFVDKAAAEAAQVPAVKP